MSEQPQYALSIRQPWAWLILNWGKRIENRSWPTKYRGPVWLHASQTMTKADYEAAVTFCMEITEHLDLDEGTPHFPSFESLRSQLGGIVGEAHIVGCVDEDPSPWFVGKYGFLLEQVHAVDFLPCKGALKFFKPILRRKNQ
jgi:hypothetical protein